MQRTGTEVSRWQEAAAEGDASPTPCTLTGGNIGTCLLLLLLCANNCLSTPVRHLVGVGKQSCMHAGPQGSSPYHCPMCGVWVSSQPLLEAHFKGRRHLKRALEQADTDAAHMGLQPGTTPEAAAVPRSLPCPPWAFCSLLMCLGKSLSPS